MVDTEEKAKASESGHGSTLFVSNLPYTATSVDLQTLFSDFAPVRSAFVVTEQGSGVSKGVGYVSFALREDAQSTFEAIAKDGISLVGRALRIEWAENKKPRDKLDSSELPKKEVKPKAPRQHQPRPTQDAAAIRTIVVSGLPGSIDSKVLWKKIRKYDGAEKLDWPVKTDGGEEDPSTAHVLFATPSQAATAINKLHAHVYKGSLLSVALKKRLDNLSKPFALLNAKLTTSEPSEKKKGKSSVPAPSHSSRLIVRNIPFEVTEQDIRATFLPYGPIYSIHIPMDAQPAPTADQVKDDPESSAVASAYSSARKPRTKGFAFVWMLSKKDAERAMEGCNGTVMRAGSAKKMADDKQKKKKEKRLEEKKLKEARAKKVEGEEDVDVEMEDVNAQGEDKETEKGKEKEKEDDDMRAKERVIAVDWALSKDRWEGEKAKVEAVKEDEDVEMAGSHSDDSSNSDSDSDSSSGEEDGDNIGVHEDDSEGDDDAERDDDEVKVRPELPAPEQGTTVFVRNVPFDATEEELRTLFRSFGSLRYARITLDPATGRSRGTGFACFWNKDDADRAVQQSELLRLETTGQPSTTGAKKNPFSLPSILTPDPSSSLAQSLVLHGRTLDVVTAVTRDVAGKLKDDNERSRQKEDKRNMYLLREGVILPNSPAAVDLPGTEVERRTTSFNARRTLLKSNPSLYISKTRLSVRQIPTFVTERMLRRLVGHGVKKFEEEVKAGQRQGLTDDERTADSSHTGDNDEETKPKTKSKADKSKAKRLGLTRQAKIVRQAERIDGLTGKGKSKGYGFVEMQKHADALRFLRWANCNPEVGVLVKEWWKDEVELLIEDEKKRGKEKAKVEEKNGIEGDEMRLKRLKEELERVKDEADGGLAKKARGGLLIVEFSIENVQVVQRRKARQKEGEKTSTDSQSKTKDRKRKRDTLRRDFCNPSDS